MCATSATTSVPCPPNPEPEYATEFPNYCPDFSTNATCSDFTGESHHTAYPRTLPSNTQSATCVFSYMCYTPKTMARASTMYTCWVDSVNSGVHMSAHAVLLSDNARLKALPVLKPWNLRPNSMQVNAQRVSIAMLAMMRQLS